MNHKNQKQQYHGKSERVVFQFIYVHLLICDLGLYATYMSHICKYACMNCNTTCSLLPVLPLLLV